MIENILSIPSLTPEQENHRFKYFLDIIKKNNKVLFKAHLNFDLSNSKLTYKQFKEWISIHKKIREDFNPNLEIIRNGTVLTYKKSYMFKDYNLKKLKEEFEEELSEFVMLILKKISSPCWIGIIRFNNKLKMERLCQ